MSTPLHIPTASELAAIVTNTAERQIATTRQGKAIAALVSDSDLRELVACIAGNLGVIMRDRIELALEAAGVAL